METINSIFIECRKWHHKTGGDTYFSNRIQIDGQEVCRTGIAYGYGEHYLWDALKTLKQMGLIPTDELRELRKLGIVIYNSESFVLKRDLFKTYTPEPDNN